MSYFVVVEYATSVTKACFTTACFHTILFQFEFDMCVLWVCVSLVRSHFEQIHFVSIPTELNRICVKLTYFSECVQWTISWFRDLVIVVCAQTSAIWMLWQMKQRRHEILCVNVFVCERLMCCVDWNARSPALPFKNLTIVDVIALAFSSNEIRRKHSNEFSECIPKNFWSSLKCNFGPNVSFPWWFVHCNMVLF